MKNGIECCKILVILQYVLNSPQMYLLIFKLEYVTYTCVFAGAEDT